MYIAFCESGRTGFFTNPRNPASNPENNPANPKILVNPDQILIYLCSMAEPRQLIKMKASLQKKRMPVYHTIVTWARRLLIAGVAGVTVAFLVINFTAIPSFRELEDPTSALASEVLANNGDVLGRYFIENRVPVAYEDLNPHLVNALIATEDERFRSHSGIDARAVGRVVIRTVLLRDQSAGGGSTITQQLAKNLYSDRNFKDMNKVEKFFALVYRKLREWITAIKLEKC
jgi:penicillin-binding protein 1A